MLRCYVSEHPENWDEFAEPLTNAFKLSVHRATCPPPFDLALSRTPPELTLHYDDDAPPPTEKDHSGFTTQLQTAITKAHVSLSQAQRRYKTEFDKRLRRLRNRPTVGGWIFLDPSDAVSKPTGDDKSKLRHVTEGPYKVLDLSSRAAVIQRGLLVERVAVDRIIPAPAPITGPESHKYAAIPADLAAKNLDGEAWLVDGLLKHRLKRNGSLQFLVQWAGDFDQTWEPRANIPEELISCTFAGTQDPHTDYALPARATKKRNSILAHSAVPTTPPAQLPPPRHSPSLHS